MNLQNIILLPDSFNDQKHLFKYKNLIEVDNIPDGVCIAKDITKSWKTCILSPWAPSYNLFKSFEKRWEVFKNEVKK